MVPPDKGAICLVLVLYCSKIVSSQRCDQTFDVVEGFGRKFVEDGVRSCFRCVVNNQTSPTASWLVQREPGSEFLAIDPAHGEVVNGVLVLYNPTSLVGPGNSNRIEAQCSALTRQLTVSFFSKVLVPPTVASDLVIVNEGDTLRVVCTDNNPSGLGVRLKWQRLDGSLMTRNAVLRIENITRSFSGVYQCIVTNESNETLEANTTIVVQYLGEITTTDPHTQDVLLAQATPVTLSCNFNGVPTPTIRWLHNGNVLQVSSNDGVDIVTRDTYSELKLSDIRRDSGGTYTCSATNAVGFDTASVMLRVIVPPAPVTNLIVTNTSESSVSLAWEYGFDGNSPIAGVQIEMYKDGELIETRTLTGGPSQESVQLTGLDPLTDYVFVVYAMNTVMQRSAPVRVNITTLSKRLSAPEVTSFVVLLSSSLYLEWEPPLPQPETTNAPSSWLINYMFMDEGLTSMESSLTIQDPDITNHTFTSLLKGTRYEARVAGINTRGIGTYSGYSSQETLVETPSSAPRNFEATTTPRSITFHWEPPTFSEQNGDIIHYMLTCAQDSMEEPQFRMVYETPGTRIVRGFRPYTSYNCSVFATNNAGSGPASSLIVTTKNESVIFQLRLTSVKCVEWVATNGANKVNRLASLITNAVKDGCSCDFTEDRISDGVFQCFPESPQAVTYRAVLHGTTDVSVFVLLEHIRDWAESDGSAQNIRVDFILLRVDTTCDVRIASTNEKECKGGGLNDVPGSNDNNMLHIILGSLGGVLLLILLTMVVIMSLLAAIYKLRPSKRNSAEEGEVRYVAIPVGNPANGDFRVEERRGAVCDDGESPTSISEVSQADSAISGIPNPTHNPPQHIYEELDNLQHTESEVQRRTLPELQSAPNHATELNTYSETPNVASSSKSIQLQTLHSQDSQQSSGSADHIDGGERRYVSQYPVRLNSFTRRLSSEKKLNPKRSETAV